MLLTAVLGEVNRAEWADVDKAVSCDWSETDSRRAWALQGGSLRTERHEGDASMRALHWPASLWTLSDSHLRHALFLRNKTFLPHESVFFFFFLSLFISHQTYVESSDDAATDLWIQSRVSFLDFFYFLHALHSPVIICYVLMQHLKLVSN